MSNGFNKNLIQKFLTGFGVKSDQKSDEDKKTLSEIETEHLQKMLSQSISGDKAFGDIPGLDIERTIKPAEIPAPVSDATRMYNKYEAINTDAEKSQNEESDPIDELELALLYIANQNIYTDISMKPINTFSIEKGMKFNTLEDAAKYILKKRGKNYTDEDVHKLTSELLILNSENKGKNIDEKVEIALKNINSGKYKITDENKYSYFTNLIKECGFELNPQNAHIFQTIYTILDTLQENNNRENLNIWKSLQATIEKAAKSKDPEKLKYLLLVNHGINIYSEEEQEKAREIELQNFTTNILSGIYGYLSDSEAGLHNSGSLFYDIANLGNEGIDKLANLLGKDMVTMREDIEFLKSNKEIWNNSGSISNEEFKKQFKVLFGKEYNEELAQELMDYCTKNPNFDVFKDSQFCIKLSKLLGVDIVTTRKINLKSQQLISGVGDILFMMYGMKLIGGSEFMSSFNISNAAYFQSLGLSGKALQLAIGMPAGALTFGSYKLLEGTIDNGITGNLFNGEKWEQTAKNSWDSVKFGAFASALNILLISPVVNPQIEKGMKAAQKLVDSSERAVTGEEFFRTFYKAQEPLIKSSWGKFAYSTAVNTAGFTAYGVASDVIANGTEPLKNGNAGKYLGTLALENLKTLLTFEGLQMLIGGMIAGKTGANSARELTVEDISNYFESLKQVTIEKCESTNGNAQLLLKFPNNVQVKVNNINEVLSVCVSMMMREVELKNAAVEQYVQDIQQESKPKLQESKSHSENPANNTTAPTEPPKQGSRRDMVFPCVNGPKNEALTMLAIYGNGMIKKSPISFASDDGYDLIGHDGKVKRHLDFKDGLILHEDQYFYYGNTDKLSKSLGFWDGILSDVTEYYYDSEPQYSVKVKSDSDKVEVWIYDDNGCVKEDLFLTPEEYYARFKKALPNEKEFLPEEKWFENAYKESIEPENTVISLQGRDYKIPTSPKKINVKELEKLPFTKKADFRGGTYKLLSDGRLLIVYEDSYTIETPDNNPKGYSSQIVYSKDGNLVRENRIITNDDGSYTESVRRYAEDGSVKQELITVTIGSKKLFDSSVRVIVKGVNETSSTENFYKNGKLVKIVSSCNTGYELETSGALSRTETFYKENEVKVSELIFPKGNKKIIIEKWGDTELIELTVDRKGNVTDENGNAVVLSDILRQLGIVDEGYDTIEDLKPKDIPDGYYYDSKTKTMHKVDKDKIRLHREGDEESGHLELYDDANHLIGTIGYDLTNNEQAIYVHSFSTAVNGLGLGRRLVEAMAELANEYGKKLIGTAQGGQLGMGRNKKPTNLKFYYKVGFRATDPGVDKLIRECIKENRDIPISLNEHIDIEYVGADANSDLFPAVAIELKQKILEEIDNLINESLGNEPMDEKGLEYINNLFSEVIEHSVNKEDCISSCKLLAQALCKKDNIYELLYFDAELCEQLIRSNFTSDKYYESKIKEVDEILQKLINKEFTNSIQLYRLSEFDKYLTEIFKNAQSKDYELEVFKKLVDDCVIYPGDASKINDDAFIATFKKAYEYLKANKLEGFKICIADEDSQPKLDDKTFVFDKNGEPARRYEKNGDIIIETIFNSDCKQEYKVQTDSVADMPMLNSERRVYDKNGNLLYIERYERVNGSNKYNISRELPNGKKYLIGTVETDKFGTNIIEKSLISKDGTKTNYVYINDPSGNKFCYLKITDSQNQVTCENSYKYRKIDENHFQTIENEIQYDIIYSDDQVQVTRSDGQRVTLSIGKNTKNSGAVLSEDLVPLLKQMPGSFYFDIENLNLGRIIMGNTSGKRNAGYRDFGIRMDTDDMDATFTLCHEFGHFLAEALGILENQDILDTFAKEREKCKSEMSSYEFMQTQYLIFKMNDTRPAFSLDEFVAETNALLYSSQNWQELELRSQFIQQYFPETFSKVVNVLTTNGFGRSGISADKMEVSSTLQRECAMREGLSPEQKDIVNMLQSEQLDKSETEPDVYKFDKKEFLEDFERIQAIMEYRRNNPRPVTDIDKAIDNIIPDTEDLLCIVNSRGKQRFNEEQVTAIIDTYHEYPDAVKQLAKMENADGSPRLDEEGIKELAEYYEKNHNTIEVLLNMSVNGKHRFEAEDVVQLLDVYDEHKDTIEKLSQIAILGSDKMLSGKEISRIIDIYEINPEITEKLIINSINTDGTVRGISYGINAVADNYDIYPDVIDEMLNLKDNDGKYIFDYTDIGDLADIYQDYSEIILDLVKIQNDSNNRRFYSNSIRTLAPIYKDNEATINRLMQMNDRNGKSLGGSNICDLIKAYQNCDDINRFWELLDFFQSDSYTEEIQKYSAGKYQKDVVDMLENIDKYQITELVVNGISKSDFLNSVKKLSKSTFKLAYDRPNQYLSGINLKYSTPVNGSFPDLPSEELKSERDAIKLFFNTNLDIILRVLKYVDTDTVNHLMDKRTDLFRKSLKELNQLSNDNFELLSKLLSCKSEASGKPLSPKEKIQLCQLVEIFQNSNLDMTELHNAVSKGQINLPALKQIIQNEILISAGIDPNTQAVSNYKKFNEEFSYLALKNRAGSSLTNVIDTDSYRTNFQKDIQKCRKNLKRREKMIKREEEILNNPIYAVYISKENRKILEEMLDMIRNINQYTDEQIVDKFMESLNNALGEHKESDELYTVIRESAVGNFNDFINDESNIYGQTNSKTQQIYNQEGLNYQKWINPEIEDILFEIAGKQISIRLWDRNPQEDLFMGNKTTCCTAIGTGGNAAATPVYLLNTSYNVVELYDANGNVVGMSRVFMGKIDGEPVLIMDNIELNSTYVKDMDDAQKTKIRNGFFEYMNQYAERVTGKESTQVYFYSKDIHVPSDDLETVKKVTDFVGALSQEKVYVNSAGCAWIDPTKLNEIGEIEWLKVPKNEKEIEGSDDYKETSLPNLKENGGTFDFRYTNISNLKSLNTTNGETTDLIKPEPPKSTMPKLVQKYGVVAIPKTTEEMKAAIQNAADLDTLRKLREGIKNMPLDIKALYVQKERELREGLSPEQKGIVDMAQESESLVTFSNSGRKLRASTAAEFGNIRIDREFMPIVDMLVAAKDSKGNFIYSDDDINFIFDIARDGSDIFLLSFNPIPLGSVSKDDILNCLLKDNNIAYILKAPNTEDLTLAKLIDMIKSDEIPPVTEEEIELLTKKVALLSLPEQLRNLGVDEKQISTYTKLIENDEVDTDAVNSLIRKLEELDLINIKDENVITKMCKVEELIAKNYKSFDFTYTDIEKIQHQMILMAKEDFTPEEIFRIGLLEVKFGDYLYHSGIYENTDIFAEMMHDFILKNGIDFTEENYDTIAHFIAHYYLTSINKDNIEIFNKISELEKLTGRAFEGYKIHSLSQTTVEDSGKSYDPQRHSDNLNKLQGEIDSYKQSLSKIENSEPLTQEEFINILLSKFGFVYANVLGGREYEALQTITSALADENGMVPSASVQLIDALKAENLLTYAIRDFIKEITADSEGNKVVITDKQIKDFLEFCNQTTVPIRSIANHTRDEKGAFSPDKIIEICKEDPDGLLQDITKKFQSICLEFGHKSSNAYEVFNIYLSLKLDAAKCTNKKDVEGYLVESILKRNSYDWKIYQDIISDYEFYKPDIVPTLIDRAISDGYLQKGTTLKINTIINQAMLKAYDMLPKPADDKKLPGIFHNLRYVNNVNLPVFEQIVKYGYETNFSYSLFQTILEFSKTEEDNKIVLDGIELALTPDGKINIPVLANYLTEVYKKHPEFAQELIAKNIRVGNHYNYEELYNFIYDPTSAPFSDEQKEVFLKYINKYNPDTLPFRHIFTQIPAADIDFAIEYSSNNVDAFNKNYNVVVGLHNDPQKLDELKKKIATQKEYTKYFSFDEINEYPDKIDLLIPYTELLESWDNSSLGTFAVMFEQVDYDVLKKSLSILDKVPEDVKKKFPKALAVIYQIECAYNVNIMQTNGQDMIETYDFISKCANETTGRIMAECIFNLIVDTLYLPNKKNIEFAIKYINSVGESYNNYTLKNLLTADADLQKQMDNVTSILQNKDKIIKAVANGIKDKNPDFIKYVEEYLKSADVWSAIFELPNLTPNNIVRYFIETANIFYIVNKEPQNYVNGFYEEDVIKALKEYRKTESEKETYNKLSDTDQAEVENLSSKIDSNIRFEDILQAIAITDLETVKSLLDLRFEIFTDRLEELLSVQNKKLLSDLIRHGKRINKKGEPDKLTGRQKLELIDIIKSLQNVNDIDIDVCKTPLKKGDFILDIDRLRKEILSTVLKQVGLTDDEASKIPQENILWDMQYVSLMAKRPPRDEGELEDIVRAVSFGDFRQYIEDTSNKYGQTNLKTKEEFRTAGLDFTQFDSPDIEDVEFEVAGKKCKIKFWKRNPYTDMFLGSRTSCCTALNRTNGGSMGVYMLNESYNFALVYDETGNVVGMSRMFMAMVDGKPSLIMDNIELNNNFVKNMSYDTDRIVIRDNLFKYINQYAQKVTGDSETQVYFYSGDIHVPNKDLPTEQHVIDFIGEIHRDDVYINANHCSYTNPKELKNKPPIEWLVVPKN